jgi:hypothetical protein
VCCLPLRWESCRHRSQFGWTIGGVELRRERRARLDERLIGGQPAGHIDGDRGNDTPVPAIRRHEAAFRNRTLRDYNLIGDRWQTD